MMGLKNSMLLYRSRPEVEIPELGVLRGILTETYFSKRPIYNFLGVSYAAPPSGNQRFQVSPLFIEH